MNRETFIDVVGFGLNLLIIFLLVNNDFLNNPISIGNYFITLSMLITTLLLLVILIFKNINKIYLILNIGGLDSCRVVSILVYNFYYFSLILTFLYINQLSFTTALILMTLEFVFIIFIFILRIKNAKLLLEKNIIKLREGIFFLMILGLSLKNVPFILAGVPFTDILVALYVTIMVYICWILYMQLAKLI